VKFSALFITALIVGLGHAGIAASPPKTITGADTDRPITVQIGQEILLKLESNRSTGYSWLLEESKDPVLRSLGKPTYQADRVAPGAGGVETWTFRANKIGNETLRLEYRRPWERKVPPAKTVLFHIAGRQNGT